MEHPTLAVVGFIHALGAIMPQAEMQARWVTRVFKGKGSQCLILTLKLIFNILILSIFLLLIPTLTNLFYNILPQSWYYLILIFKALISRYQLADNIKFPYEGLCPLCKWSDASQVEDIVHIWPFTFPSVFEDIRSYLQTRPWWRLLKGTQRTLRTSKSIASLCLIFLYIYFFNHIFKRKDTAKLMFYLKWFQSAWVHTVAKLGQ